MKHSIHTLALCLVLLASCHHHEATQQEAKDSIVSAISQEVVQQSIEAFEIKEKPDASTIKPHDEAKYTTVGKIPCPDGYERLALDTNTSGHYLRGLPLKTENNIVYLFSGEEKWNQDAQFAIVKMDVGKRDLQQCADAVMRLRAEYLFGQKRFGDIHFNFLSDGKPRFYTEYAGGDRTHGKFRKYMDYIFAFANTASLKNELKPVNVKDMQVGDVFIQSGDPFGHAITVMDMAENKEGEKVFMLSQSYMPAQEIHILRNKEVESLSPWYPLDFGSVLITPEWTFEAKDLRRFEVGKK